jgi:hypothetical protein
MATKAGTLIWWLSQDDQEAIAEAAPAGASALPAGFPRYLREEYESRDGRSGRGRLWVGEVFGGDHDDYCVKAEEPPWSTPLGVYLAKRCGGIVIRREDAALLRNLPGVITDRQLRRATP